MSFLTPVLSSSTRCVPRCGTQLVRSQLSVQNQHTMFMISARFKSKSARPPPKPAKPTSKSTGLDNSVIRKRGVAKVDSAKKASLLLNSLRKSAQLPATTPAVEPPAMEATSAPPISDNLSSPRDFMTGIHQAQTKGPEDEVNITIDAKEEAILRHITFMRKKLLWPGIWTLFALAGTYGTLAYLDVKAGVPSSDDSHLPERIRLPQTWYLTPTVVREGVIAGWNELDNLTIGIVVATFAIHLLKRSPLPIWEMMIHITGESKWTAFTYPLVNASWAHAASNMTVLAWFLPSVVRYFDGDLFHTTAFLVSVPLITSYFTHFAYRFNLTSGLAMNLGASGAIVAALGVYSVAYANEKVWVPQGLVLRLDAMYWGLLFAASQIYGIIRPQKGGNRPAHLVCLTTSLLFQSILTLLRPIWPVWGLAQPTPTSI